MKTEIEHKYPVGAKLIDPRRIKYEVTGILRRTICTYYELRAANGSLRTERVLDVDGRWTEEPKPVHYVNVYADTSVNHPTRESADRGWPGKLATVVVYDDGRVELVEEGQDED